MRDTPLALPQEATNPFLAYSDAEGLGSTYVLWAGPSLLDGAPIVVLASRTSANRKTGNMIQTWILRSDMKPTQAYTTGHDISICGDCALRSRESDGNGGCYVVTYYVNSAWAAWFSGNAGPATPKLFRNRYLRIGSYGDPAAVPLWVWDTAVSWSKGHTGYTHQWRDPRVQPYKKYLMASADDPAQTAHAQWLGWRTFTFHPAGVTYKPKNAIICPAARTDNKVQCIQCRKCDGSGGDRTVNVVIQAHGNGAKAITWENFID